MDAVAALIPPIGVGILFFVAMRSIIGADRRERAALAELERAERAATERKAPGTPTAGADDAAEPRAEQRRGSGA